jgi:hypothetical protein
MDGFLARSLESAMLRALKAKGAVFANKSVATRFDGWTEAWTKASLNVTSIKQIMEWVYEDEV